MYSNESVRPKERQIKKDLSLRTPTSSCCGGGSTTATKTLAQELAVAKQKGIKSLRHNDLIEKRENGKRKRNKNLMLAVMVVKQWQVANKWIIYPAAAASVDEYCVWFAASIP